MYLIIVKYRFERVIKASGTNRTIWSVLQLVTDSPLEVVFLSKYLLLTPLWVLTEHGYWDMSSFIWKEVSVTPRQNLTRIWLEKSTRTCFYSHFHVSGLSSYLIGWVELYEGCIRPIWLGISYSSFCICCIEFQSLTAGCSTVEGACCHHIAPTMMLWFWVALHFEKSLGHSEPNLDFVFLVVAMLVNNWTQKSWFCVVYHFFFKEYMLKFFPFKWY